MKRNDDLIAEHAILVRGERRYRRYALVQPPGVDICSDGSHDPGSLVSHCRRQAGRFQVVPLHEHRFRTIQTDCVDPQRDFALGGLPRRYILDFEDLGSPQLVEAHYSRHFIFSSWSLGCPSEPGRFAVRLWHTESRSGMTYACTCIHVTIGSDI